MDSALSFISQFFDSLGNEHGLRLFDALSDVRFFIKNSTGVYLYVSRAMFIAHGFSNPKDIVGTTDHDFIPAYLADQYTRDDKQVLGGTEIWGRIEMVTRHPGCPDWHVTSKIPLRSRDGSIIGLAGISRDLHQTVKTVTPFHKFSPVLEHIREHFTAPLNIGALSKLVNMSPRTFQRHFKDAFEMTPSAYIRQVRIGEASQRLLETDETITSIAQSVGFSDHSHLVREFVRATHITPGVYRKQYRKI